MNINALKNRLVKKASMQKVAGVNSKWLKKILSEIARVRNDKNIQSSLKRLHKQLWDKMHYNALPNFNKGTVVETLKKPTWKEGYHGVDVNNLLRYAKNTELVDEFNTAAEASRYTKYIDRLDQLFNSKSEKIERLGGEKAAEVFAKNLKDKYL